MNDHIELMHSLFEEEENKKEHATDTDTHLLASGLHQ
jgi:hypothetical protein